MKNHSSSVNGGTFRGDFWKFVEHCRACDVSIFDNGSAILWAVLERRFEKIPKTCLGQNRPAGWAWSTTSTTVTARFGKEKKNTKPNLGKPSTTNGSRVRRWRKSNRLAHSLGLGRPPQSTVSAVGHSEDDWSGRFSSVCPHPHPWMTKWPMPWIRVERAFLALSAPPSSLALRQSAQRIDSSPQFSFLFSLLSADGLCKPKFGTDAGDASQSASESRNCRRTKFQKKVNTIQQFNLFFLEHDWIRFLRKQICKTAGPYNVNW